MEELQEHERKRKKRFLAVIVAAIIVLVIVSVSRCGGGSQEPKAESQEPEETNMVWYPGRTFDYKRAFNDQHAKQFAVASKIGLPRPPKDREDAASMRSRLVEVKTCGNYIVDDLTHSALASQRTAALPVLRDLGAAHTGKHQVPAEERQCELRDAELPLLRHDVRPRVHALRQGDAHERLHASRQSQTRARADASQPPTCGEDLRQIRSQAELLPYNRTRVSREQTAMYRVGDRCADGSGGGGDGALHAAMA